MARKIISSIIIALIGSFLIENGWINCTISGGSSRTPTKVEISDLEKSKRPDNKFLLIGKHMRMYYSTVYSFKKNSNRITHAFYPIVSSTNAEKIAFKSTKSISSGKDKNVTDVIRFSVLVKTYAFNKIADLEEKVKSNPIESSESLKGLVINDFNDLRADEKSLITDSFPGTDWERVLIIEENGEPSSYLVSILKIIGGIILIAFAILRFVQRKSQTDDKAAAVSSNVSTT